jgi:hypothetical protein
MAGPRIDRTGSLAGNRYEQLKNSVADQQTGSVWGNTYYVDSGHGSASDASGKGTFQQPFATIDYAIGQCTASQGDQIHVAPGHAETIAAATDLVCDVQGVRIIGHGDGTDRPTLTFSTLTTATVEVDAANVWIENIRFVCNKDSLEQFLRISAAHCTVKNCWFEAGATQALDHIELDNAAADYCRIEDCRFFSETAGAATAIAINAAVNDLMIRNCDIQGDWSTGCIDSASAHLNCSIIGNFLRNDGASDHAIEFTAAATGIIAYNAVGTAVAGGGAATVIDCGSCKCIENYAADADADTSGVLTPPAT